MSGDTGGNQETLDESPRGERHERLAELGRGGMGVVYKARDLETGEVVALKVLRPEIATDQQAVERFKNELRLARKITHKNVCRIHEFHRTADSASISMEYVEGESLRSLLSRPGGISVRFSRSILQQVMAGLAEAHAQDVTHRDLKPENIMVACDGTTKIMDFGIARSAEGGATLPGVLVGTPAYMSPEQAEGRPADTRSDLYALGLIIYEMFTGQPAFHAETPVALAMKQVHETPPPARRVEPYLPEALDRAIQKCLEKDPQRRFQSVAELEAALNAPSVTVTRPEEEEITPPTRLSCWSRADGALLIMGLAGALFFLGVRDRAFPASRLRLEVDAPGARRIAGELAGRLGRPQVDMTAADVQLDLRREMFIGRMQRAYFTGAESPDVARMLEPALVWRVRLRDVMERLRLGTSSGGEVRTLLDHRGKLEALHIPSGVPGGYQPKSVEEVRVVARQAAELACGPMPPKPLTETMHGDSYEASFGRQGTRVVLVAEKVSELRCRASEPMPLRGPVDLLWLSWALVSLAVLTMFLLARAHQAPYLWRRLPAGLLLGCAAAWVIILDFFERKDFDSWAALPDWPQLATMAFAAGVPAWIALVTAEHYLRRRDPEKVASYVQLWRGRLADPAIGLAVLRGAALGLVLVAVETGIGSMGQWVSPFKVTVVLALLLDPAPVAQAILSGSPAGFTVAAAVLDAALVALVFLGLSRSVVANQLRSKTGWRRMADAVGLGGIWVITYQHLHLAGFVPIVMGFLLVFLLEAYFLAWVLDRYDVLTVAAAVATAVLWTINYPLLVIFSEIGNTAQWAVFLGWGAAVLLAAGLAFRTSLGEVQKRMQAAVR